MTAWWNDLSARERQLLMIGGAVVAFAVLFFLIIRPLTTYRQNAMLDYDRAVSTYRQVTIAAAAPQEGALDPAALRSVITSSAQASGIVINRISSQGAVLDVSIAGTSPARLYGWIAGLEAQHNVHVQSAQLRPSSENGVTARLTLMGGGA